MSNYKLRKVIKSVLLKENNKLEGINLENIKGSDYYKELIQKISITSIEYTTNNILVCKFKSSFFVGENNFIEISLGTDTDKTSSVINESSENISNNENTLTEILLFIGATINRYSKLANEYFKSDQIKNKIVKAKEKSESADAVLKSCLQKFKENFKIKVGDYSSLYAECDGHKDYNSVDGFYISDHDTIYIPIDKMINTFLKTGGKYGRKNNTIIHEITHRHKHYFKEFNNLLKDATSSQENKDGGTKKLTFGKITVEIPDLEMLTPEDIDKGIFTELEKPKHSKISEDKKQKIRDEIWKQINIGLYNIQINHIQETCIRINQLAVELGKQVDKEFIEDLLYWGLVPQFKIPSDFKELQGLRFLLKTSDKNINYFVKQCNRIAKAKSKDGNTKFV